MLHFILPDASNAHYMARVFVLRASPMMGCHADNMISTLFSFASYHQYITDGIRYID